MGGGGRPRWGEAGKGASLSWNVSPCPPPLSPPLQLPALPLIEATGVSSPPRGFMMGTIFRLKRGMKSTLMAF